MADIDHHDILLKVLLHFNGSFELHPKRYAGGDTFMFTDVDFAGMELDGCANLLERFIGEPFEKMYYCLRTRPLATGIRFIEDQIGYAHFLDTGYEDPENPICLYLDHTGNGLEDWFDSASDVTGSLTEAEDFDVDEEVTTQAALMSEEIGLVDEIIPDEQLGINFNKTADDAFLSKLCPNVEDDIGNSESTEVESHCIFNPQVNWKLQKPILGMRFESPKQMKEMLCNYAVANGYQLYFQKNDKTRLLVGCCKGACPFRLWGTWMSEEHSFQIKSLKDQHQCSRNYKLGSIVNYKWIGGHYTKDILHKQKLTIRQLRLEVIKKFGIDVSLGQCRRAKKHALTIIEGTLVEHYAKLWSYGEEIRRTNPGSTVKMGVIPMPDGKTYFSKFYVCFEGVKRGWLNGCRRVVGIDGCFLKGFCSGELLCAVGKDANNQIYPIAWAVVCVENKENWKWFLDLLIEDLNLHLGQGFTIMSDQHKGLMEAVKELLPHAEHRQCARHIATNFQKRFPGAVFENLFWKACKATTEQSFKAIMQDMESISVAAHKYLMDKNPKTWSRAYYETGRCCAAVENGSSESFNAVIVEARKKPIITMLEELRLYMMDKLYKSEKKEWSRNVSPTIRQKLNALKVDQRFWHVLPSGLNQFETRSGVEAFEVDLDKKTCSCRLWQLNGYGCVHSVAAISHLNRDVEWYVDRMFTREMYRKTYQYTIHPTNGSNMWPSTNFLPPLPPLKRRMPGRPATKRKRDVTEGRSKHKVSKVGKRVTCSICNVVGHNKKTCPSVPRTTKLQVKRPRVDTSQGGEGGDASGSQFKGGGASGGAMGSQIPTGEGGDAMGSQSASGGAIGITSQTSGVEMGGQSGGGGGEAGAHATMGRQKSKAITRRKKSERIILKKLATVVLEKNGEGNTSNKPVNLE